MSIPILTSEGFVGQRWIVDDYFLAGETLHCGDVVGVRQGDSSQGRQPRVFKIRHDANRQRVIGFVHTLADQNVGDQAAAVGEAVQVVVQGVAQALSDGTAGVGDPVTPGASVGELAADLTFNPAARVKLAAAGDPIAGRCLSVGSGSEQVIEVLVDIAGGG